MLKPSPETSPSLQANMLLWASVLWKHTNKNVVSALFFLSCSIRLVMDPPAVVSGLVPCRLTYRGANAHEGTMKRKHVTQTLGPRLSSPAAASHVHMHCRWFRDVNQSKQWRAYWKPAVRDDVNCFWCAEWGRGVAPAVVIILPAIRPHTITKGERNGTMQGTAKCIAVCKTYTQPG